MTDRPLVVFGLDGACFELIQPWLDDGRLPTLAAIIDDGVASGLESCVPATTPPAWTSLTTGVNPGKHGVFGFYARIKGSYDLHPVSDADIYARRLWDYASEEGLTSLVVNVPVTHPPRELDGAIVPGYMADDDPATYPPGVLKDLGFDGYTVYAESEAEDVPEDQLLREWLELTESRRDVALALMEKFEWDILFLEFQKTDGAVHKFSDRENVRRVFERVDNCMGDVLEAVEGEPNVFVVSDHGIGQEKDWAVALNTWLEQSGYVRTAVGGRGQDTSWIERGAAEESESSAGTDVLGRIVELAGGVGLTKQRVERILSALGLYHIAARHAPASLRDLLGRETIDRSRSTAFYEGMGFSGVDVGVLINDDRFYEDGVVAAHEYDEVRSALMDGLRSLQGPDGEPFRRVLTREEMYNGPRVDYAPDIILEQAPRYVIGSKHLRGQVFIPTEAGRIDHMRNGLLVAAGPDVRDDWTPDGTPSIMDVTPTLLHLLELPVNTRIDGTVLESILVDDRDPKRAEYDRYEPADGPAIGDEEQLKERLEAMGYLG